MATILYERESGKAYTIEHLIDVKAILASGRYSQHPPASLTVSKEDVQKIVEERIAEMKLKKAPKKEEEPVAIPSAEEGEETDTFNSGKASGSKKLLRR